MMIDDDYDDDYDDELPPISVNNSKAKNNNFVMPSADVLASQRAREEECEQEICLLRSQYECSDNVMKISSHDSSGSECEGTLAAAIEAMKVHTSQTTVQLEAIDIIRRIITSLTIYDTTFLRDYLDVLHTRNMTIIKSVTENIMSCIEQVIKINHTLCEDELLVTALWLCAACLWSRPRVPTAGRALHVLLTYFTVHQVELLCAVLSQSLSSVALVRASDAICSPLPEPRRCAALLLRAAFVNLKPALALQSKWEPLCVQELHDALPSVWRDLPAPAQYTVVQVVGRVLSDSSAAEHADNGGQGDGPADGGSAGINGDTRVSQLLTLLATPPPNRRYQSDYLKVLVAVSKLQNLFHDKK